MSPINGLMSLDEVRGSINISFLTERRPGISALPALSDLVASVHAVGTDLMTPRKII
jgi:hypothetical protein